LNQAGKIESPVVSGTRHFMAIPVSGGAGDHPNPIGAALKCFCAGDTWFTRGKMPYGQLKSAGGYYDQENQEGSGHR
jgi:hypothetical protein